MNHNSKLTKRAQSLRSNATRQENHLWYDFLARYPVRFRRQVTMGHFIVDFYCAKAMLAIELDGSQHYEPKGLQYDAERSGILEGNGIMVLRIPNNALDDNFEGVCEKIDQTVKERMRV